MIKCDWCGFEHTPEFDCKPLTTGNVSIGGLPWYEHFNLSRWRMTKDESYVKIGDLIDSYLKHLADPNNPMRRRPLGVGLAQGVSFSAGQQAQIQEMAEAGKTVEAQRLILGHLEKELGASPQRGLAGPDERS